VRAERECLREPVSETGDVKKRRSRLKGIEKGGGCLKRRED
jgi:hypothetical protein